MLIIRSLKLRTIEEKVAKKSTNSNVTSKQVRIEQTRRQTRSGTY